MSERSAQKLMQAARSVLPGSAMANLSVSKIQAILALQLGDDYKAMKAIKARIGEGGKKP